ncbi:hypothetical protein OAD06_02710 [Flavobacteriaceae bacterium]|jgi:hypothetical protein|nr:hypothetical protein [Flavobacteriaceae bacterium]
MSRAMYDYTKAILNKVSFDVSLFCIELKKALTRLLPHEIEELKIWVNCLLEQKPQLNKCLIYLNA